MKNFIKKNWIKFTIVIIFLIIGICIGLFVPKYNLKNKKLIFTPYSIEGMNVLGCELLSTGGIYDKNSNIEKEKIIEEQPLKQDKNKIKFTLKEVDQQNIKVLIGDSMGVDETVAVKISENQDYFVAVSFFGLDKSGVQVYTVYKNTGFFTFTRTGNMILIGDNLMYGYGRCY